MKNKEELRRVVFTLRETLVTAFMGEYNTGVELKDIPTFNKNKETILKGFFHTFSGGQMSENIAIIESEDGLVYSIPISNIKFI